MATITDVNLNRVAVFARVVEAGGFTAAANALGVPKSSASRSVRQLEDALGVRLLQRTTRRLRLTGAGQAYYERVASALAGLDEARAAALEAQDVPRGVVRLAAPSEWGSWLLTPVVARFVARYPEIRLDVSLTNRDVDLVREGFDLAVRLGKLKDSSLIVRTVGALAGGLFAAQSYVDRRGIPSAITDLAMHDIVGYRKEGGVARLQLDGPDGAEHVVVNGPVVTDDLGFVHEAVRLGLGIGLLPVSGCTAHFGLVRVLPQYAKVGLVCSVVYPSSRYVPLRVALFRDALVQELQERFANPRGPAPPCLKEADPVDPGPRSRKRRTPGPVPGLDTRSGTGSDTRSGTGC
jgi:DNA-binding transcriptional LysR family regulator